MRSVTKKGSGNLGFLVAHPGQPNVGLAETAWVRHAVSLGIHGERGRWHQVRRSFVVDGRALGATAPLDFTLIAGGRSNLTFLVTDAARRRFALRRPPTSHVLPTAHDMVREFTIISALHPLGIPVATPLGLCTDESINDRPFYVMEFVEGAILRDRDEAEQQFSETTRAVIGENLAATLAQLHDVDVDRAGLGDLAKHDHYIERQLKRWRTQYEQMHVEGVEHGGLVEAVGDQLAASIPPQQRVSVVHGDYRLDNTVLDRARCRASNPRLGDLHLG